MKILVPPFRIPFLGLFSILSFTIASAPVDASLQQGDSLDFCAVGDFEQGPHDYHRPAGKRMADLNVGEPRTVRLIYFLPSDRPYRSDVVDSMKTVIRIVQSFFAEQMETHGYGAKTFRLETDAEGKPLVHRVNGEHSEGYYFQNIGAETDEIEPMFDFHSNVYFIVIDYSSFDVREGGGIGIQHGKNGGYALISGGGNTGLYVSEKWSLVAHELGHVFGLRHDFRNDAFIMSYGSTPDQLSACAAKFLAAHTYFNPGTPIREESPPKIELISPVTYPADTESVSIQVDVEDSDGLHQVLFFTQGRIGGTEMLECREFSGVENAVVEFDYDGIIPSDGFTSLSDPPVHTISVIAVDLNGNLSSAFNSLTEISPFHIATLEGHGDAVNSASFSPDGTLLASGSWDSTVKLWDVATRKNTATLEGHMDRAEAASVSFSPDGTTLAFASWNSVKLWDVATGEDIATLEGHTSGVVSVSFSPDGATLASASWDNTVKLWHVATGKNIATLEGHTSGVISVSFSPDGATLASASQDNTVKLWDVATGEDTDTLEGSGPVSFSPDGKILAFGSDDFIVRLWDLSTGEDIATLGGTGPISFSPDGSILAVGTGYTVELRDLATGTNIATLSGHHAWVRSISFSPEGTVLGTGSYDGQVILWDTSGWTRPRPTKLVIISGDEQQGAPGSALAHPFTVEVRDQFDKPLPDVSVTFTVIAGKGRFSERFTVEKATTDADGRASRILTLGPVPGTNAVEVSLGGNELVTFHAESVGTSVSVMGGEYRTWHVPWGALLRFGKGWVGGIYDHNGDQPVAFSPDGNTLAAASSIGVWLYEVATSRELALLPSSRPVRSVSFSSDGTTLAFGSDDGTVKLWDVSTSTLVATLEGHRGAVSIVAFSPDGIHIVSAGGYYDPKVKLWDKETGTNTATFDHHTSVIRDAEFSPDGSLLATAGGFGDPTIRVWDVVAREPKAIFEGHRSGVLSLSFSPDGTILASGSDDYSIKLWDVETGSNFASLKGHTFEVTSVSFSPDGNTLASGSRDFTVKLWDMTTREPSTTLSVNSQVTFVSFSPDGRTLVYGLQSEDKIGLWDVKTGNTTSLSGHMPRVASVSFSPDGRTLATGSAYTINLWDVATRNAGPSWHFHSVSSVSFSPDGTTLASGSGINVVLWNAETGEKWATLEGHITVVNTVTFSPDGTFLASGSRDNTVKLWDVSTREQNATLKGHSGEVWSVAFTPDGTTLASGADDGTVKLWNVATQELIATLEGHGNEVRLAFSPDGEFLVSGSNDNTVRLWDVTSRSTIAILEGTGPVAFSPDGTLIASGAPWGGGTIKLWNVLTREEMPGLEGHTSWVRTLSFSPDGQTLASGSFDGTILLWDMQLLEPRPHTLIKVAGDKQQSPAGAALGTPFVVWVRDQHGDLFAGAAVTFTVTAGDGTLSATTATTDANGRAETTLTLGRQPGGNTVEVTVADLDPVVFTAVGQAIPQSLAKVSGDQQEGPAGAALSAPFVVSVLDQNGDPLAGTTVTFAVAAGGGTLSATTDTTDENGLAAATLTLGGGPGGNTVDVTVAGLNRTTFTALGIAIPRTLSRVSGDQQQGAPGTTLPGPFVVSVLDQNGTPLAGAAVTFAVTAGDGTLSATTATTDANGRASSILTLGNLPGASTVTVSVAGLEPVTFTATAEASPDFDGDGETGFSDFFLFADAFGSSDPRFDLDGSGTVDFGDFFLLADHFADPTRGKLLALAQELIGLPEGPQLRQNAPNPFNSETVISWFLLRPGSARIEVFALTGQRVAVLQEGPQKAGVHRVHWNGRDHRGRSLASGVYLYRLVSDESVHTRKLTLLR